MPGKDNEALQSPGNEPCYLTVVFGIFWRTKINLRVAVSHANRFAPTATKTHLY